MGLPNLSNPPPSPIQRLAAKLFVVSSVEASFAFFEKVVEAAEVLAWNAVVSA